MPLPQLKPEILLVIFKLLLQPLPPVQARFDDRSAIRQPDLVHCLKVCKAWYQLAGVILYRTIVTDDLPRLLYPFGGPAHVTWRRVSGVFSKTDLLGMTKHLFLEYCPKDPGDSQFFIEEALSRLELNDDDEDSYYDGEYEIQQEVLRQEELGWVRAIREELVRLDKAMLWVAKWPEAALGGKPLFGRLTTLSVGAILGYEEEHARRSAGLSLEEDAEVHQQMLDIHLLFHKFVAHTTTLEHVCINPYHAPLSFGTDAYLHQHGSSNPSISSHALMTDYLAYHPHATGVPVYSYIHQTQWGGLSPKELQELVVDQVRGVIMNRDELVNARTLPAVSSWDINATIYRSLPPIPKDTPLYLFGRTSREVQPTPSSQADRAAWREESKALERAVAAEVAEVSKNREPLPGGVKPMDKFTFRPLFEAMPCPACGWRNEFEE